MMVRILRPPRRSAFRFSFAFAIAAFSCFSAPAQAASAAASAARGLALAKRGECVKAVPLLEDAELGRHRPLTAVTLADCYVMVGELIRASEMYHAVSGETPQRSWVRADFNAYKAAKQKAEEVDLRIPTISFKTPEPYEELEVEIDGHALEDLSAPKQVPPDVSIEIVARAEGRKERKEKLVLNEGERRTVVLRLDPLAAVKPAGAGAKAIDAAPRGGHAYWLGARYQGAILPRFVMNTFAEGGTTVFAPGGALTFTSPLSDVDLVFSLGYMSYRMGETPFKPKGAPDTDWEIVSSDMHALMATVELMWSFPLDAKKTVSFRIGGGVGVGFTFLGDLYRTQAYPPDGQPGDPSLYLKCKGPNNPPGSFRYCNTLDKDADHYHGYTEPSWFDHGYRPLVYPWLALPQLGLSWRMSPAVTVDIEAGLSLSGILTSLGIRFGL